MQRYNTFISFSYEKENLSLVKDIKNKLDGYGILVDYSEKEDRRDCTNETIWKHLLNKIKKCSITIVLLTDDLFSSNVSKINYLNDDFNNSGWIYKEISASLRNHENNKINGVICVVPNEWYFNGISNQPSLLPKIIRNNISNINKDWINTSDKNHIDKSFIEIVSLKQFNNDATNIIKRASEKRDLQIEYNDKVYDIDYEPHNYFLYI